MIENLKKTFTDSIEDRLKDPILGAFAISFLIFNWDLVLILFNFKADFHHNIFHIKTSLAPFKLQRLPNADQLINHYIKGWHLLRFIVPTLITYLWIYKWSKWTEQIFINSQTSKISRQKIVNDLTIQLLKTKELILDKAEELNQKEQMISNKNNSEWDQELNKLLKQKYLNDFIEIINHQVDDEYLSFDDVKREAYKLKNLDIIKINVNPINNLHIDSVELTDKGQYFYKRLILDNVRIR